MLLLATKLTEKIPKGHYQSFIRKKNAKSLEQWEIITYQPKFFENLNIVDIKSVITEHPKTPHKLSKTFKGFTSCYNVKILNSFNPETQLKDTESAINNKLKKLLTELKVFIFVTTLVLVFKKIESENKTKYDTIINENDTGSVFQ